MNVKQNHAYMELVLMVETITFVIAILTTEEKIVLLS